MASVEELRRLYAEAWRDGVRDAAREVLDLGGEIIAREAIDQGDLLASGEVEESTVAVEATAVWRSRHSVFVHYGTRKAAGRPMGRMPPLEPFVAWVKRNLTVLSTGGGAFKAGPEAAGRRPRKDEVLRAAQAVRMKVWREGTEGLFYATRAAALVRPRAPGIMLGAVERRVGQGR